MSVLLAVDVGNTNTVLGVFRGDDLVASWRIQTVAARTSDEYAVLVRSLLELDGFAWGTITAGIISSVVPPVVFGWQQFFKHRCGAPALVVGPGIKTGMPILYENPREVGADRIVNAVAGYEWAKGTVIVVDFGTATTFDCVTKKGEYLGGIITPGVQISADALFARAARLHRVDFLVPPRAIGRNSTQSMQSGIVYGYAAMVDGLCARLKRELSGGSGDDAKVIATGGLAELIGKQTEAVTTVDRDLTLTGLALIHQRNVG